MDTNDFELEVMPENEDQVARVLVANFALSAGHSLERIV